MTTGHAWALGPTDLGHNLEGHSVTSSVTIVQLGTQLTLSMRNRNFSTPDGAAGSTLCRPTQV